MQMDFLQISQVFSGPVSMPVCPGNLFKLITYHKSRNFINLACITTVVQFPFG